MRRKWGILSFFIFLFFSTSNSFIYAESGTEFPYKETDLIRASITDYTLIERERGSIPSRAEIADTPFVIMIQDAHAHPEAQYKIASVILELGKRYGPLHVLVEGGAGKLEPAFFSRFSKS